MLKEERHTRMLEILGASGRLVAAQLQEQFDVSGDTIRRDLDELARSGRLHRVRGGALARSPVPRTYEGRGVQGVPGKREVAAAAVALLSPGQVAIIDGGSTALALAQLIPQTHTGTVITHSPLVAAALGQLAADIEIVVIGGVLDRRAMVHVGAQTLEGYSRINADICFLGVWSLDAERGISEGYSEEAAVRRAMLDSADSVVALASREKLGTIAPFGVGPAEALTYLATERDVPPEVLAPFVELGITVVR